MLAAAKEHMLEGREPSSQEDWELIVNFMAHNIAGGLELAAMKLLKRILEIPLDDLAIKMICEYQAECKQRIPGGGEAE